MSLPTTLIVPNNLVAGTDALAADLNGNNSYITGALNTTNTAVNANTAEIAMARSGETSLDVRIDSIAATANAALPASYLDTDGTLVGNSDVKVPSQKAVKTYVTTTAFSAALPSQTGNAGKFVTTDGTNASWGAVVPPQIIRVERTSNTMLGAADQQKLIDITNGTFTQTFDAAATLGEGWYCYIRNSGTGVITLDPDGAETIDGLASLIMNTAESVIVICTGTAFITVPIVESGDYRLLSTITATNAATVDIETFSAGYDDYLIVMQNGKANTGLPYLTAQLKIGGTYITTGYDTTLNVLSASTATPANVNTLNATSARVGMVPDGATDISTTEITIPNANSATLHCVVWRGATHAPSVTDFYTIRGGFGCRTAGVVSGVRLSAPPATLSGTFMLYGKVK